MKTRFRWGIACAAAVAAGALLFDPAGAGGEVAVDTGSVSRTVATNYFGTAGDQRYEISFRQASLREVLQFLAWIAEFNVIIPEGLDGIVNASFAETNISDAMSSIIKANNLEYTVEGGIVRIGRSEQFKESGEDLKTETFRLRFAPATEITEKGKMLLSTRGSLVADERTNSVVVRDLPGNIGNVRRFIEDIDVKDAQVLIEAKILEATRNFARALGIQWGANKATGTVQFGGLTAVGQADSGNNLNVNLQNTTTPLGGLLLSSVFKGVNLEAQLLAAETRGDAYIISDPSIVTSNGKAANIRSGSTLLIQSTSTSTGTTGGTTTGTTGTTTSSGVEQIETGVELKVTPQITIQDYVKLDIEAVTSTPDFTRTVNGVPIIVDNKAKTTVLVKDGETTVIGGLSRFTDSLNKRSVPYLSKIPILGNLFKSKERIAGNTELMVFIRPTIIRTEGAEPAQMRVREVEERREAMYLEPILTPGMDQKKIAKERKAAQERRGNKYVR